MTNSSSVGWNLNPGASAVGAVAGGAGTAGVSRPMADIFGWKRRLGFWGLGWMRRMGALPLSEAEGTTKGYLRLQGTIAIFLRFFFFFLGFFFFFFLSVMILNLWTFEVLN
jgi:hypothetical protein